MPFLSSGGHGGLIIPDSATIPFADNAARDAWASANLGDLINSTTAVNVTGQSWFVWRGETNPASYDSSLWVNGDEIVKGQRGDTGPKGDEPFNTVKVTMLPAGSAATSVINGTELDLGIPRAEQSPAVRQAVRFLGMFETESELNLQEPSPREGSQCIVLTPTQSYYEFTKGVWTKGREVGDAHSGYLGRYADETALKAAHPKPTRTKPQ